MSTSGFKLPEFLEVGTQDTAIKLVINYVLYPMTLESGKSLTSFNRDSWRWKGVQRKNDQNMGFPGHDLFKGLFLLLAVSEEHLVPSNK